MRFGRCIGVGVFGLLLVSGATEARAVTFVSGDVFASVAQGNVQQHRPDGTLVNTLNIGTGGFTTGMAFDAAGNLYVTGFGAGTVAKFDANGNLLDGEFIKHLPTPESIVFDSSGHLYVGTLGGRIKKFDLSGTLLQTFSNGRSDWIDLKADQKTMLYTQEGGQILQWDLATDTALPVFATIAEAGGAFALRILPDGGVLLADEAAVRRFNSAGVEIQTYDAAGEDTWFALNLDPDGTSFWSGNFGSADLYRFHIASGAMLKTFNTGTGGDTLFGVGIFGEKTQGCTECGEVRQVNGVVPEPASMLLFGFGFGPLGLLAMGWRS